MQRFDARIEPLQHGQRVLANDAAQSWHGSCYQPQGMLAELGFRFLLGGAIVSLFAAFAEMWDPKTFAGLFGAAPSVALATLALGFYQHGGSYVAIEARAMVMGSIALLAYSAACVAIAKTRRLPLAVGAAAAWTVWLVAALGLWRLGAMTGIL
ncbi:MAG TPA: hypothetical protein VK550_15225 [Polyangiaceae bacterium]|nr:hypothetical protein [Polyangiaceae bacterium]